jgi:hypothetical protein
MNFEEFKNQWNKDETDFPEILPENLLQKSNSVIERVRKNIRLEFYLQVLSMIIIGFMMFRDFGDGINLIYPLTLYILAFVFSIYYYVRFFMFYRKSFQISTNTKDGIFWFYNELRLNIELYRSHIFTLLSLGLAVGFIAGMATKGEINSLPIMIFVDGSYVIDFLILGFCFLLLIAFCELWIWFFYSKYLKRIKDIYDEIKLLD